MCCYLNKLSVPGPKYPNWQKHCFLGAVVASTSTHLPRRPQSSFLIHSSWYWHLKINTLSIWSARGRIAHARLDRYVALTYDHNTSDCSDICRLRLFLVRNNPRRSFRVGQCQHPHKTKIGIFCSILRLDEPIELCNVYIPNRRECLPGELVPCNFNNLVISSNYFRPRTYRVYNVLN